MELLGYSFSVGNELGYYAFLSFILLFLLYYLKPKPIKKVIPSLIFLQKTEKRITLASFFRRIVRDWLFIVHFFIILFLCLAAIDLSSQFLFTKINKEVVLVIDASASSQAEYNGKMLFNTYKDIAKKNVGVSTSIVLIKNSPEVIAKQTNPVNAVNAINFLKPSGTLSNIWDSMITASSLVGPGANIVVISDFSDTNDKDLGVARNLLEAKGYKVEMINPRKELLSNIGIINYRLSQDKAVIDVRNYNDFAVNITTGDSQRVYIPEKSVGSFTTALKEGTNEIRINPDDDFKLDDKVTIIVPKVSEKGILYITNSKKSFVRSAMESIRSWDLRKAEPPIVNIGKPKIIVFDGVTYNSLLPGTLETIQNMVEQGSSLVIVAQENMDMDKLGPFLPLKLVQLVKQDAEVKNTATLERFRDFDFGLASKYFQSSLINNNTVIFGEAYDKFSSPVIVMSRYGKGTVFFYGIFDDTSAFKLSPQFPLFWINVLDLLSSRKDANSVNLRVGEIIYAEDIKTPSGEKAKSYLAANELGIYRADENDVSVNLMSTEESNLNKGIEISNSALPEESEKMEQEFSMTPFLIILVLVLSFLDIYVQKKRGEL
jgi:hypothetical protein